MNLKSYRFFIPVLVTFATSLLLGRCAVEPDKSRKAANDESTQENEGMYVENGNQESGFPATGVLIEFQTNTDGTWGIGICTATVICDRVILTAAHCKNNVGDKSSTGSSTIASIVREEFRTDPDILWIKKRKDAGLSMPSACFNGNNYGTKPFCTTVSKLVVHPEYVDHDPTHDIALGKLADKSPSSQSSLSCGLPKKISESMTIVGYGQDSKTGTAGVKESGTVSFSGTSGQSILATPGSTGQVANSGDSGGPLFYGNDVIGINSQKNSNGSKIISQVSTSLLNNYEWISAMTIGMCSSKDANNPSGNDSIVSCSLDAQPNPVLFSLIQGNYQGSLKVALNGPLSQPAYIKNCPAITAPKALIYEQVGVRSSGIKAAQSSFQQFPVSPIPPLTYEKTFQLTMASTQLSTATATAWGSVSVSWQGQAVNSLCYREKDVSLMIPAASPTGSTAPTATPTIIPTKSPKASLRPISTPSN